MVGRKVANKKGQNYLDDVDNDALYYLYTVKGKKSNNAEYIDGLYELMKDINADKTIPNENKKVLNEKMANEAKRLEAMYKAYVKGDKSNTVYLFKDQDVSNEYFDRKINEKVQAKINAIEKELIRYR